MFRMKLIVALAVVAATMIADPAPETGPQFQGEYAEVPDPVPVGYDRCITVIVNPEHIAKWGRVYTFQPPFSDQRIADINTFRRANIGKLQHCRDEQS